MGWFPVADASFAAVLREQGADVMQPLNLDADDVVARLAIENDAMILSGDRDMLRYEDLDDKENRIKQGFAFALNNSIKLIPRTDFQVRVEPRRADSITFQPEVWRKLSMNSWIYIILCEQNSHEHMVEKSW